MFSFPEHCRVDRVIPKERIYSNAGASKSLKNKFVRHVEKITWTYKLSPDTLNLPAKDKISEIQVFDIALREKDFPVDILNAIDKSIPYPIVFILRFADEISNFMAFKKISSADTGKISVEGYFKFEWQRIGQVEVKPLPAVLDMRALYEELMRCHVNIKQRDGETLEMLLERALLIRQKERDIEKLESRMNNEKQFNRKVDLNSEIKNLRTEIKSISK